AEGAGGRGETRNGRSSQRSEQKQEAPSAEDHPVAEKPARDLRLSVEVSPETDDGVASEPAADSETGSGNASGARRWRGRRRRRSSRGAPSATEEPMEGGVASGAFAEELVETESEIAPEIHAAAAQASGQSLPAVEASAPFAGPSPVPFVLPGESLSKYGGPATAGAPADTASRAIRESAPMAQPAHRFKPSTLIETPIAWDGSGLLPGESIAKRGNRPAGAAQETDTVKPDAGAAPSFIDPTAESGPESGAAGMEENPPAGEDPVRMGAAAVTDASMPEAAPEPRDVAAPAATTAEQSLGAVAEESLAGEEMALPAIQPEEGFAAAAGHQSAARDTVFTEPEPDAAASHNLDPLPPSGFRLFGLGGKKKSGEEAQKPSAEPVSVPSVSAYAPGEGVIEEEVIEGEETDVPRHLHHPNRGGDHDLDDLEEETLPPQMRSGDLGEMLQEAHLDHRIQMDFDAKNGDEESLEEAEDEEETAAEEQPESSITEPHHRERGVRSRRGRGGAAAPGTRGRGPSRRSAQLSDLPIISDLLKPGQEILVQIAKEPIAKKGARITSHIALPGRFLVFMPTVSHIGVSRKIASDEERHRLKRILLHERGEAAGGFIVRTAAEGASEEELRLDLRFLLNLWSEIKQRSDSSKSPALIYHDLSLIERILRDQVSSNFSSIWVDSEADYERIVRFLNRFSPSLVRRVKLYTKETPLFEHFGIQDEISKALRSKVWLKSGGSIVINQTEALVAIDINTGKYVGKSARLEDTIVKTNLDAVPEIVRQIRLRDLGGIIVIDFIDMDDRKNRYKVMAALEEALKADRAPTKVLQFNDFGLVAITRKRVKQSLERTLSVPCPTCQATGMVKGPTTVCNEIYIELRKMKKHFENDSVLLRVNPETVKALKANNGSWLTEFEELVGRNVLIKSDPTLHPEQFDIQG
ncbi:MAG: Rne/Rng family ribonuclease, partial [Terracidiphilus sp.]